MEGGLENCRKSSNRDDYEILRARAHKSYPQSHGAVNIPNHIPSVILFHACHLYPRYRLGSTQSGVNNLWTNTWQDQKLRDLHPHCRNRICAPRELMI